MSEKPDLKKFDLVPIETAITPKDGYVCMVNYWWEVWDGHLLAYHNGRNDLYSPQCNKNIAVTKRLKHDACDVAFIPVVYWRQRV